jgi:hypothetical protein
MVFYETVLIVAELHSVSSSFVLLFFTETDKLMKSVRGMMKEGDV